MVAQVSHVRAAADARGVHTPVHTSRMPPMPTVFLAPYLKLPVDGLRVGPWHVISADALRWEETASDLAFEQAKGLLDLYHRSRRVCEGFGVFLRRGRRLVGEDYTTKDLDLLRTTLLVALLDTNPSAVAGDDTTNAGHQAWTSDNVQIIGHGIDAEGHVAMRYGAMSTVWVGGLRIGDEHSEIAPPIEMPFPMLGRSPDPFYCDALWDVLRRDSDDVRRTLGAIAWLDLAWRNTPSTTFETRILMLKAGFEVLLGCGDRVDRQRSDLSALLDPPRPRLRVRRFATLRGQPREEAMSDLEWWFTRFTFLRNTIIHGERPTKAELRHGRNWHLWIAEYRLRQAIKELIARHGHPLVRLDPMSRALALAIERYGSRP
jgi:hypothetical protein